MHYYVWARLARDTGLPAGAGALVGAVLAAFALSTFLSILRVVPRSIAGVVWTEHAKTEVGPGDVLFLPRKLSHSVQCVVDGGFDVVGVICPGDNPSISY